MYLLTRSIFSRRIFAQTKSPYYYNIYNIIIYMHYPRVSLYIYIYIVIYILCYVLRCCHSLYIYIHVIIYRFGRCSIIGYDCLHWALISGQWDNEELMLTRRYHIIICRYTIHIFVSCLLLRVTDCRPQSTRLSAVKCFRLSADVCEAREKHFFRSKISYGFLRAKTCARDRLAVSTGNGKKIVPATQWS